MAIEPPHRLTDPHQTNNKKLSRMAKSGTERFLTNAITRNSKETERTILALYNAKVCPSYLQDLTRKTELHFGCMLP